MSNLALPRLLARSSAVLHCRHEMTFEPITREPRHFVKQELDCKERRQRIRLQEKDARLVEVQVQQRAGIRHRRLHRTAREPDRFRGIAVGLLPRPKARLCRQQGGDRLRSRDAAPARRDARAADRRLRRGWSVSSAPQGSSATRIGASRRRENCHVIDVPSLPVFVEQGFPRDKIPDCAARE
jgi:hypothetical protein